MYNPKTGELIIIDENYELPERPSLTKGQLRKLLYSMQHCTEIDEFIDVVSAINARIVYDLEEKKIFKKDQKELISDFERKDTLMLIEKELGIERNKKETGNPSLKPSHFAQGKLF